MWNEINSNGDIEDFMKTVCYFHDSCVKEIKYLSGAYVNEQLTMYPVNDKRILKVVIQRQFQDNSMIEMEFMGLRYLQLFPITEEYTCEILDCTMTIKNGNICWCDSNWAHDADISFNEGTMICAQKLRWRKIDGRMGESEFYTSAV